MYIELPSHSLLQGGPFFFADFCDRVKKKTADANFLKKKFKRLKNNYFLKI